MTALKSDPGASELAYAVRGVGGDETCNLQLVVDSGCKNVDAIIALANDDSAIYNTMKIRLESAVTVSSAIKLCKASLEVGWKVIVSCAEESPEGNDTFIADFAVGVGASQFMGGGLLGGEFISKYNRLLEIQRQDPSTYFVGVGFRN
jgi:enolase